MPESQQELSDEYVAALTEADIPPENTDWALDEAETGRPAELAGLSSDDLAELIAAQPRRVPGPIPAGCLPRDGSGGGSGFADGGVLDELPAGRTLAGFAADADQRADDLDDDSLIGLLRAHDRQASHEMACKLAIIAKLARRRPDDRAPAPAPGQFPELSEFFADEIAMALTLTRRGAEDQVTLALELDARPAVAAALQAGRIDLYKARILLEALAPLAAEHAAAVQAAILPAAGGLTSGQLRAELTRAILALDPEAMRNRREKAEKDARVELWTAPDGTATLAGRDLPPAAALAANKRLCQVAAYWKKQIRAAWKQADPAGQLPRPEHGTDLLRAWAYLALLNGLPVDVPPAAFLPPAAARGTDEPGGPDGSHPDGSHPDRSASPDSSQPGYAGSAGPDSPEGAVGLDGQPVPPGLRRPDPVAALPPMAGLINLTLPLTTLLGVTDHPGEAAGMGPLHADTARLLACALAGHRATRWQVILTDDDGHALAAGAARGSPGAGPPGTATEGGGGWTVKVTAEPIATHECDHRNQEPGHDPSPGLQRLIRARTSTCTGPGCRRPAGQCDLDHTVPYDQGGITCECGVGPGCRRCHRRKQALGWKLEQPSPGVMIWTSPAGRRYTTRPSKHPT
jgi:hypothetical protein